MHLTVTLCHNGIECDIMADPHQPISNLFETVWKREAIFVKSELRQELISGLFTLQDADIQTGDVLTLV